MDHIIPEIFSQPRTSSVLFKIGEIDKNAYSDKFYFTVKTFQFVLRKFLKTRIRIFNSRSILLNMQNDAIIGGIRWSYLFSAWLRYPSKAIAYAMHMSIYTYPLNIVPSNIHDLKHHKPEELLLN